jgi:hypothetical protein
MLNQKDGGANPSGSREKSRGKPMEKPSAFGWKYVGFFSRKKFP